MPIVSGLDPVDGRSCGRNADPEQLRAPARRRARRSRAGRHAGRADRAQLASVDDQLGVQEHARGDRERLAQRLVPHRRRVPPRRGGELLLPRPDEGRDPPSRRQHLVVRGRGGGPVASGREGRRRGRGQESRHGGVGGRRGGQGRRRARGRRGARAGRARRVPDPADAAALAAPLRRVRPGASAHGVVQGAQGRPPRCRRDGRTPGTARRRGASSRGRRADHRRGRSGAARREHGRAAARGRAGARAAAPSPFRSRATCPACGGAVERILLPPERDALDVDDAGLRAEGAVRRPARGSSCPTPSATSSFPGAARRRAADRERSGPPSDRPGDGGRRDRARRSADVRLRADGAGHGDRDRRRRRRDPPVRPSRGRERPGDGRPRGPRRARRCRRRLERRPGRLRRQRGRRQRGHDGGRSRPDRPPVRQRQERLCDRWLVARRGGARARVGRGRGGARRRVRQASARRLPERSRRLVAARLVRRGSG